MPPDKRLASRAAVFSMMRANDLIWSYVVNNYLMAEDNLPFDMVFWFQDATRLPARMIHSYLDNYYNKNLLAEPGGLEFGGECLDLGAMGQIMAESRDADELLDVWTGWRTISPPICPMYERFVELNNEGAGELGFAPADLRTLWGAPEYEWRAGDEEGKEGGRFVPLGR